MKRKITTTLLLIVNYITIAQTTELPEGLIVNGETEIKGELNMDLGEGFKLFGDSNYFGTNLDGVIFQIEDNNNTYVDGGFVFRGYTHIDQNYQDWMVIKNNGKIGIGTNNPTEKLTIQNGCIAVGDITNDNWSRYAHLTSDGYGYDFQHNNASAIINEHGSTNQAILLGDVDQTSNLPLFGISIKQSNQSTDWLPRFTVTGKGNVGIGTITPQNELSVNGTIWAKEVKIRLVDAADWVFNKDYKLKPLAEVESYIKANKHLPEIPSAEEFRKNDLKVSEITNKLLQKIEELTLYTIQQQKEILRLNKRLNEIETQK